MVIRKATIIDCVYKDIKAPLRFKFPLILTLSFSLPFEHNTTISVILNNS